MKDDMEPELTEKSPLLTSSGGSRSFKLPDVSVKSLGEDAKPQNMVPFGKLFSFADGFDWFLMLIGSLAATIFGGMQPGQFIIFGSLTDDFIDFGRCKLTANCTDPPDIEDSTRTIAYWYVGIAHVILVSGYLMMTCWGLAAERQNHKIRLEVFRSILRQDIAWFDNHDAGELNSRLVDDLNKIVDGMGEKLARFIQCMMTFIGAYVIGFIYGWKLTLSLVSMLPLMALSGGIMGMLAAGFTAQEVNAYAKAGSVAEEVLSSMRTVAAFSGEEKETERYSQFLGEASRFGVKKGLAMGCGMGFLQLTVFGSYTLAFWYGSKLVIDGDMSSGDMLTVFFSVVTGSITLGQIGPNLQAITTSRAASYSLFEIIDRKPDIDSLSEEGVKPEKFEANVDFKNVRFRYPTRPDLKVLRGFSLHVPEGKTAALVGGSGCGKSTVVKIIQRFYEMASGGAVKVGGYDIKSLNVKWLRSHIGVVSQEPVLFATTIAENISYGREGATMADIEKVAKQANAHSFISQFPQGYHTLCGERGAQMSGGQKQRIAIARALIKNPRILLLDEATSALDTESESIVQDALDKASEGRTTIVIAHRLSTIKNADMIVAVNQGKVNQIGTHDELMAAGGIYKDLVTLQMLAAEKDKAAEPEDVEDDEENVDMKLSISSSGSVAANVRFGKQLSRQLSRKSMVSKDEIIIEEDVEPAPIFKVIKLNFPEWRWMALGSIGSSLTGAFPFVFALILGELMGVLQHNPNIESERETMRDDSRKWALMFLAIGAGTATGFVLQNWMFAKAGESLTARLRKKAFAAMLRQDIGFFDDVTHSTGALCTQLSSHASAVQGATGPTIGLAISSLVTAVGCLSVAYISGWKLSIVITAFVPFIVVAGSLSMLLLGGKARYGGDEESGQIAIETISNMQTVASLGREELFYERYVEVADKHFVKSKKGAHYSGLSMGTSQWILNLCSAASMVYAGKLVNDDEMDFPDVMKVLMAIIMGSLMIGQLAALSPDFGKGRIGAAHLFKLFSRIPVIDSASDRGVKPDGVKGNIQFRKIEFRYPARQSVKVLRRLNLEVKSGETLALVGSSGCGKSTSVALIERFYNPETGSITLDDNEINALNLKWLRGQIGIVSQEPVLFDLTIRENIAYGDNTRDVSMEEIIQAAKNANIHDFISSLTDGYETRVGDKGTLISGGQKQRIAIARALVRNPKILLLDEATSALDTESEKVVQDALDKAREGRTTLVIAHRLSTIQNANCIVVLRKGKVIEQGTHQELINKRGAYYVFQKAQALGSNL